MQSHTILGSKSQRGLTQMAVDVIFKSLEPTIKPPDNSINPILLASVAASDPCEAQFFSAQTFLGAVYGDPNGDRDRNSRAQTPMGSSRGNTPLMVRNPYSPKVGASNPCCASVSVRTTLPNVAHGPLHTFRIWPDVSPKPSPQREYKATSP